jgi:hypothetical protein
MKPSLIKAVALLVLGGTTLELQAQTINVWRGDENRADWSDNYKWKLQHPPQDKESAHFREPFSVVAINQTVELNNGIQVYGQELTLVGNGNINLRNPVPHQRTINIPASASGYANMTLNNNLSINGRIALAAKAFGTSASKGSITLRDRTTVIGDLLIGNAGSGTGQVFVRDRATYRITSLDLQTLADIGGSAEIHIISGTVRIETKENPFNIFLQDSSRKIMIGDTGILRIESNIPSQQKKELISALIIEGRLMALPGCRLKPPVINDKMLIIQAEDERNPSDIRTTEQLIAAINNMPAAETTKGVAPKPSKLESLLQSIQDSQPTVAESTPEPQPATIENENEPEIKEPESKESGVHLAGYIVFFGTCLLALRRPEKETEENE